MKRILVALIMAVGLFLGTYISVTQAQPVAQPTYTPNPTLTPRPTYTDFPTYTPNPTYTPCPPTPYPTSTSYPTATNYFTQTPYPTSTPYPDQFCGQQITYYVSMNGDDNNTGAISDPWETIQKAANSALPGSLILVSEGVYDERVIVNASNITFQSQGNVIMNGFSVYGDYVSIHEFEITNTPDEWADGYGIYVAGSYCSLDNNYIHFATRGGILLTGNNCGVTNNKIYRSAMVGIDMTGHNHLVEDNEVWGIIQYHPNWINPPNWVDADGFRIFGSGHLIRRNYIHDITYDDPENVNPHIDCFQSWTNEYNEAMSNTIIEWNVCEVLENQTAYENGQGFMISDTNGLIIRNNIIKGYGGVSQGGEGPNENLTIINNVFVNDLSFQFFPLSIRLGYTPNLIIKNNIFYNQPYDTISLDGIDVGLEVSHNLAYRTDGLPSECYEIGWQCHEADHHYWDIDPMFVDPANGDYHLQFGSPAIDAGVDVGLLYYGSAPDIGAFEFVE